MAGTVTESSRIYYRLNPMGGYILSRGISYDTGLKPDSEIEIESARLDLNGWLHLRPGFTWDGASCALDTKDFMRGSAGHDAIYYMAQQEKPIPKDWKKKADSLLNRICREDGMTAPRRWWVRVAVRNGGKARPRDINRFLEERVAP